MVSVASKDPPTSQVKEGTPLGEAPSSLSQNSVIHVHIDVHFYFQGLRALSLLPLLDLGSKGRVLGLYFYTSLGQGLWEWGET